MQHAPDTAGRRADGSRGSTSFAATDGHGEAVRVETEAGVVDQAAVRLAVDVADAGRVRFAPQEPEHRFEPAGQQRRTGVEQAKHGRAGDLGRPS